MHPFFNLLTLEFLGLKTREKQEKPEGWGDEWGWDPAVLVLKNVPILAVFIFSPSFFFFNKFSIYVG